MGLLVVRFYPVSPCLWGQYSPWGYGLAARLLPEVSPRATTSTTSIPAMSAARPQLETLGAFHMLGMAVGVATADAGAGVGVAADVTLMLTVAVLPALEASVA